MIELDHPNIVKFFECMYDNHYINLVMELLDGISLSHYMLKQKGFKFPED